MSSFVVAPLCARTPVRVGGPVLPGRSLSEPGASAAEGSSTKGFAPVLLETLLFETCSSNLGEVWKCLTQLLVSKPCSSRSTVAGFTCTAGPREMDAQYAGCFGSVSRRRGKGLRFYY